MLETHGLLYMIVQQPITYKNEAKSQKVIIEWKMALAFLIKFSVFFPVVIYACYVH